MAIMRSKVAEAKALVELFGLAVGQEKSLINRMAETRSPSHRTPVQTCAAQTARYAIASPMMRTRRPSPAFYF
jgi:hypothetical protein